MAQVFYFHPRQAYQPQGFIALVPSQRRVPADTTGTRLWLPSDLGSKLQMWLKGDDLTGASGSSIATWTDATANANNATGATVNPTLVTSGLNGMNTVGFDGTSQYFTLPTGLLSGRTQSASFAVYQLNASPPPADPRDGPVLGDWGTENTSGNHDPYLDGNFYEDYCSTTRRTVTTVPASTAFRIFGLRSKSADWRLDVNGTNYYTDGTNTFGGNSAPLIGSTRIPGPSNYYLQGQIAEIVDCNDFLLTSEKEQVEGYLAWKWGLEWSLPVGHTYAASAPRFALTSDVTLALTGQSLAGAIGSLLASTALALTGQSGSVAQGSVGIGAALSGQSLSVAQGSVAGATSAALSGQSATVTRGAILAATSEALSGQSLTAAQGALSPNNSLALTGQSSSAAQGSVTQSRSLALSGQGTTLAQGSVSPAISVTISGQSLVVGQGSVTAVTGATVALTGLSLSVAQGSIAPALTVTLSGQAISLARGSLVPVLGLAITGQALTTASGLVSVLASTDVTLALTGQSLSMSLGSVTAPSTDTYKFWRQPPLTGRRTSPGRSR